MDGEGGRQPLRPRPGRSALRLPVRAALVGALLLGAARADAVLLGTGDGAGNTPGKPPLDDPGVDNVGSAGGLTAVYLGSGWVLTADHVGEQDLTLAGVTYPAVPGSKRAVKHDGGWKADLAIYRIVGVPPLRRLTLAATPPRVGERVVAVGNGSERQAPVFAWDERWAEVPPPGVFRGYKRRQGKALRWGRNQIDAVGLELAGAGRMTRAFALRFDERGLPDEMLAVHGDSGGGVFVKRDGEWQLAGILFLLLQQPGQPRNTAVFGDRSAVADVAFYRDQLMALTHPEIPLASRTPLWLLAGALLATAAPSARRWRRSTRRRDVVRPDQFT